MLKDVKRNQLIRVARQLGLQTRALRLDMESLGKLTLPCILHRDLNHFVVLASIRGNKVMILAPAIGRRWRKSD